MSKVFLTVFLTAAASFGQYKMEPAGAPPEELAAAIRESLQKDGAKIVDGGGAALMEIWLRTSLPSGPQSPEEAVTMPTTPEGVLVGAIRFAKDFTDRRGQAVPAGVYTMRYGRYPVDGAHQGAAPQRDFLVLVQASGDSDLNATPSFKELMALARKASGSPHPMVLSMWKEDHYFKPGFAKEGEHDWVWQTKIGDMQVAIILIGRGEG